MRNQYVNVNRYEYGAPACSKGDHLKAISNCTEFLNISGLEFQKKIAISFQTK